MIMDPRPAAVSSVSRRADDREIGWRRKAFPRSLAMLLCATALTAAPGAGFAQEVSTSELFNRARESAFSGQREQAKEIARQILQLSPTHADARTLLGRLHTWDREFEEAREQLTIVLQERPHYTDARRALVDVEIRSGNYDEAIRQVEVGLEHAPGDPSLLAKKSAALRYLDRWEEAEATVLLALESDPDNAEANTQLNRIRNRPLERRIKVTYQLERLNTFSEDWHTTSIQVSDRVGDLGSLTLRTNLARRFGRDGAQFEIDAYPSLVPGIYGYLNFGFSGTSYFPSTRYGAELHFGLGSGFEGSAGARHLRFDQSSVTVWTASLTKYRGRYLFAGRTYITPKDAGSTSVSGQLTARYYLGDRYNFLGLTLGFGSRPDIDQITEVQLQRLGSQSIRFDTEFPLSRRVHLDLKAGYRREELPSDSFRYHATFGTGLSVKF